MADGPVGTAADRETKEYYIRLSQHHAGRVEVLQTRVTALEAALRRYGSHDEDCHYALPTTQCPCGLLQALAPGAGGPA